jgi:hypothetical protein
MPRDLELIWNRHEEEAAHFKTTAPTWRGAMPREHDASRIFDRQNSPNRAVSSNGTITYKQHTSQHKNRRMRQDGTFVA